MSTRKDHCYLCEYAKDDAAFHMDHHLCKNDGNAPWQNESVPPKTEAAQCPKGEDGLHDFDDVSSVCLNCGKDCGSQPKPAPQAEGTEYEGIKGFRQYIEAPLLERIAELESSLKREKESKNTAYSERDRLVCAISKIFPSWLERHPDSDVTWEDDWRWIVFVTFPTGQASWHIHDSELEWFDHLERRNSNSWDGHSTAEKYARIEQIAELESAQPKAEKVEKLVSDEDLQNLITSTFNTIKLLAIELQQRRQREERRER